jgi:integrase
MCARPRNSIPSFRLDASHGCGRVVVAGFSPVRFPGKFGSPESVAAYHRWLSRYLATGEVRAADAERLVSVGELVLAFLEQVVERRYIKHGQPTSEQRSYRTALGVVVRGHCDRPACDFSPVDLKRCRDEFVKSGITRVRCNQHVQRIRRCWRWGVSEGMVPAICWQALQSVEGLRHGEGGVESGRVLPVSEVLIAAVEPFVSSCVWAAIQFQCWTGCRPGEALALRLCDTTAHRKCSLRVDLYWFLQHDMTKKACRRPSPASERRAKKVKLVYWAQSSVRKGEAGRPSLFTRLQSGLLAQA